MKIHPLAGKPAPPEMLIDVAKLERDYFDIQPDPATRTSSSASAPAATAARRSTARSPRRTSSPSPRRSASTGTAQGIDGPAVHRARTRTPLSGAAQRTALEVLAANGVEAVIQADDGYTPTPVISHAILAHNRGRTRRPRRRHRHHAVAQPAGRRRLQVQPAQRRPGRHRRHRRGSRTAPTNCSAAATAT